MSHGCPGILDAAGRARGRLESWRKWSFPFGPLGPYGAGPSSWTVVHKRRRISRFRLASGRIMAGIPGRATESACAVELTEVSWGSETWWSLGFEATGPADSLRSTLERSRRRLALLMRIFLAEGGAIPDHDRGVASKLAYHLTLLEPAIRNAAGVREPAELLAAMTVAKRIDNEIDRLCVVACTQLGATLDETGRFALGEAGHALEAALEVHISGSDGTGAQTELLAKIDRLRRVPAAPPQREALAGLAAHFDNLAALLAAQPDELPRASAQSAQRLLQPPFR